MSSYKDYNFSEPTKRFIEINGFEQPTQIQKEVIPLALKGKSIIGISDTGTGKTHAFLIPMLERMNPELDYVQAVITAPTRELAMQLYNRAVAMSEAMPGLRIKLITGGIERSRMTSALKVQPHIVIGTPGRIKDLFLTDQSLRVEKAGIFVVDEADMTLEYGFLEDIDAIAGRMRKDLQMFSFSATVPNQLKLFLKKYMAAPETIRIANDPMMKPKIEHVLVPCKEKSYVDGLMTLLPGFDPYICLIFANTRTMASEVAQKLRDLDMGVIEIHGDLSPRARRNAMKSLVNVEQSFIVATDIAARGIDIDGVSHVVSLGFPKELDFYIHRAGRTGRAGKSGICYALYQKSDDDAIRQLEVKGIHFEHKSFKGGNWTNLKPLHQKKYRKDDPLEKEIAKIVHRKKQVVKPGYKKRRQSEIDRLKRKAKRNMIQEDIAKQKKERAKTKQIAKRGDQE
ncbi:MAG: DEAD/DEAH box helicase [Erysipelotrichaceae bacterium]